MRNQTRSFLSLAFIILSAPLAMQAQVPAITSFSPASGPVGTTVTITGTNFDATAANNVVYFGAVAASVVSADTNQLTVTVPTGTTQVPFTVEVNGLIGVAPAPFIPTFAGSGTFTTSSLAAQFNPATGSNPVGVKVVDLDGDGKPDLVVADQSAGTISVYRNIGTNGTLVLGSFAPRVVFTAAGPSPREIAIADLDGDGKPDIAAVNAAGTSVSIFRNTSTPGVFTTNSLDARADFTTGLYPNQLVIADLNGDGKLDIAIPNYGGTTVSILRNIGGPGSITTNSFAAKVDFTVGTGPSGVASRDLDGDGKPDLAVCNDSSGNVSILRNTTVTGSTNISFASKLDFAVGSRPLALTIGDLDGDGKADVIVGTYSSHTLGIFRNTSVSGTNTFAPRFDLALVGGVHAIIAADLDGDGKPELSVVTESSSAATVFRNISTNGALAAGSFGAAVTFSAGTDPAGVDVADLDGDGRPELVTASYFSNFLSIFRNINSPLPIIITQPANKTVSVGTNVTLSVTAVGNAPLIYQWFSNAVGAISFGTNASLTLTNVQLSDSGSYFVIITNGYGSITSAPAVLTVLIAPSINTQPQGATVVAGTNVDFSVDASGSSLVYQWRLNGVAISGATNSGFSLTNVAYANSGGYSVVVSNAVGSVTSATAALSVVSQPVILGQPQSQSILAGSAVTLSVSVDVGFPTVASGTMALWLKADAGVVTNASGQVSQWQDQTANTNHAAQATLAKQPILTNGIGGKPTLRFDGIQDTVNGDYLQGTKDVGLSAAYTSFLIFNRNDPNNYERVPAFIGIPNQQSAARAYYYPAGEMGFSAWNNDFHSGFYPPTNTLRLVTHRLNTNKTVVDLFDYNGTNTTNFAYTIPVGYPLATPGAGYYVGGLGSATRNYKGDISELIYYQGSLTEGDRAAVENYLKQKYYLGASAPSGPVVYQWLLNGTAIDGATNSTLVFTNVQPENSGTYSVIVSNLAGTATSSNAVLTVGVAPAFTLQPQSQSVLLGHSVTFSSSASGTGPLSYQWQFNNANMGGIISSSFTLNNAQLSDAGSYRVVVTSSFGSITSSNAVLTVVPPTVRVENVNGLSAGSVNVPINLEAVGSESALRFSISFDSAILTYQSATIGSGAAGGGFFVNTNVPGKIGFLISAPSVFAAGTQQVAVVNFKIAPVTNGMVTSFTPGDNPLSRQISDANTQLLPGNFIGGNLTIAPVDFEGDAAPRPGGNHTVDLFDWVQVGRYVAGLDTISSAGEFQRVDCSPRNNSGNGNITVADWVQAGRYASGLDPLTPVGGPTGGFPAARANTPKSGSRLITVTPVSQVGATNTVCVQLAAQGDEYALGFSLQFDPAVLKYSTAVIGSGPTNATLNINADNAASGHLGFALTGATFGAGTQEVVRVKFTTVLYTTNDTSLAFGDSPVPREVVDANPNVLSATYTDGQLTVPGLPLPLLSINKTPTNVAITFPLSALVFLLESSSELGTNWNTISALIVTNGSNVTITLPLTNSQGFFRLHKP